MEISLKQGIQIEPNHFALCHCLAGISRHNYSSSSDIQTQTKHCEIAKYREL
jgi:hypothetical protein